MPKLTDRDRHSFTIGDPPNQIRVVADERVPPDHYVFVHGEPSDTSIADACRAAERCIWAAADARVRARQK